jgi:hypothetical protein
MPRRIQNVLAVKRDATSCWLYDLRWFLPFWQCQTTKQ